MNQAGAEANQRFNLRFAPWRAYWRLACGNTRTRQACPECWQDKPLELQAHKLRFVRCLRQRSGKVSQWLSQWQSKQAERWRSHRINRSFSCSLFLALWLGTRIESLIPHSEVDWQRGGKQTPICPMPSLTLRQSRPMVFPMAVQRGQRQMPRVWGVRR